MAKFNSLAFAGAIARASLVTAAAIKYGKAVPRKLRIFLVFLIALNANNFPMLWHFRILSVWFKAMWTSDLTLKFRGPKAYQKRLASNPFIGKSPFDPSVVLVHKCTAHVADCDYNTHLSNSSYAKNLDQARMEGAIKFFHGCSQTGVHMALGGGYFQFIKEIPMHANYEVHLFVSGWDEKWIYLTTAFVTSPKGKKHHSSSKAAHTKPVLPSKESSSLGDSIDLIPSLTEVGDQSLSSTRTSPFASGATTPALVIEPSSSAPPPVFPSQPMAASGSSTPSGIKAGLSYSPDHSLLSRLPPNAELHATAMSVYCFKSGRVTVPPRIALILSGFSSKEKFEQLAKLRIEKGGKTMRDVLRGGWKAEDGGSKHLSGGGSFWSLGEELDKDGERRAAELRRARDVMDSLAGR